MMLSRFEAPLLPTYHRQEAASEEVLLLEAAAAASSQRDSSHICIESCLLLPFLPQSKDGNIDKGLILCTISHCDQKAKKYLVLLIL